MRHCCQTFKSKKSNILETLSDSRNYGLMTVHRAENTADQKAIRTIYLFK